MTAAAGGLPIVAMPASEGVVDLLRGQPGVWLAREVSADALASFLIEALKSLSPGQRFDHAFIDPFRIDRAIHAYENLIDAVLLGRKLPEAATQAGNIRDSGIEERGL